MTFKTMLDRVVIVMVGSLAFHGVDAHGQAADHKAIGFVRMVNAVSIGTGKLGFAIDGKEVRPTGYQTGTVTGGIALEPKAHKVVFSRDGVKNGETVLKVVANETTILIPYAEFVAASENHPARWEIRILRLQQHEVAGQRVATFVSVARDPELKVEIRQADGRWESVYVKRFGMARVLIQQARGYLAVRCKQQDLSAISVAACGNFVSVLYENEAGLLESKVFQDYKYLGAD